MSNQDTGASQQFQQMELTFLGSLLPGIIHNIATPLSGVIGATQLMESRTADQEKLMADLLDLNDETVDQLQAIAKKNKTNLDIINRNANQLIQMVQTMVQRLQRVSHRQKSMHSLNELVKSELEFLTANLTFKHKVRKQVELADEPFAVNIVYGNIATVIDEFVQQSVDRHDVQQGMMDMEFRTLFDDENGTLIMRTRFAPVDENDGTIDSIGLYLARTQENGCISQFDADSGWAAISLRMPRG